MARVKPVHRKSIHTRLAPMPPYAYRPGSTPLHRLPAGVKLLAILIMTSAGFLFGFPFIVMSALIIITSSLFARIPPWELLRGIRVLFIMLVMIIILRSISYDPPAFNRAGFAEAMRFTGNMLVSFSAASLLFSVTTMTELKDAIGRAEKVILTPPAALLRALPFTRTRRAAAALERPRFSLGLSLMLGFLPRFFEVWETTVCAYQARAGKKGVPLLLTIIPLVTGRMIETAAETAAAMESRGVSLLL
ncbi:hypothetical protein FACS1894124_3670 [Spirochaetia bacterium]|nr:hypothetical protein FACS1894124_3670 [Spirochaetia bacterium]